MTHADPPPVHEEADSEIVHWQPTHHHVQPAQFAGPLTLAAAAVGTAALGKSVV